jgi:hypothetical protein
MRRTIVLLATMTLTLLVASGVALAVTKVGTKVGTNGPDTLRGTNRADNLQAMALTTHSWPWVVWTTS